MKWYSIKGFSRYEISEDGQQVRSKPSSTRFGKAGHFDVRKRPGTIKTVQADGRVTLVRDNGLTTRMKPIDLLALKEDDDGCS